MVGGCFAIPYLAGMVADPKWGFALVRHGTLLEMGWELGDSIRLFYVRNFVEDGVNLADKSEITAALIHHPMTLMMCIPMNLTYGEAPIYAEVVFVMQGASATALLIN